jgi:hypothetical protein
MTRLQQLKSEVQEAKHLMKINKPTIDFLGSQYHYWKRKKENALRKIKELSN